MKKNNTYRRVYSQYIVHEHRNSDMKSILDKIAVLAYSFITQG